MYKAIALLCCTLIYLFLTVSDCGLILSAELNFFFDFIFMFWSMLILLVLMPVVLLQNDAVKESRMRRMTKLGIPIVLFLNKCVEGKFPHSARMGVYAKGCGLLRNGLHLHDRQMLVREVHTVSKNKAHQIKGVIDMSRFLDGAGAWNFEMKEQFGNVVISATQGSSVSPAEVPLKELLQMTESNFIDSESTQNAIKAVGLDAVFSIHRFDFSVAPAGFFMTGTFPLDGLKVPTTINFELSGNLGMIAIPDLKSFNSLQARVFGMSASNLLPLLLSSMQIKFATSSIKVPVVSQSTGQHIILSKGLQIDGIASFDSKNSNPLIAFLGSVTKPFSFSFLLTKPKIVTDFEIGNQKISEQLSFVGSNFKLKPKVLLSNVAFVFGSTLEYKLAPKTSLYFTTSVQILPGMQSINLPLKLKGPWERAFGLKQLTIKDFGGSLLVAAIPDLFKALQLHGRVSFGTVKGLMYANLDVKSLLNNFFILQVALCSISQLLTEVLDANDWKLPLAIQVAILKNVKISYALVAIPERSIPSGFGVTASGDILGMKCFVAFRFSSASFVFSARTEPLKIGNFILSSVKNPAVGPLIRFETRIGSTVSVQIRAKVDSFFFANAVSLKLDSTGASFSCSAIIFSETAMVYASINAASCGFTAAFAVTPSLRQAVSDYLQHLIEENGITTDHTKLVLNYVQDFALSVSGDLRESITKNLMFSAIFNGKKFAISAVEAVVNLCKNVGMILGKIKNLLIAGLIALAKKLRIINPNFKSL